MSYHDTEQYNEDIWDNFNYDELEDLDDVDLDDDVDMHR